MTIPGEIVFGVLAFIVIGSSIGMVASRQTVYSALFLVLNFITVAMLFLTLGATFIGLTQIVVYAGAIMILFLFVIMLLGPDRLPPGKLPLWRRGAAIIFGITFLVELVMVLIWSLDGKSEIDQIPSGFAGPEAIGMTLFQKYALPLEVTSIILLVGIIGAIALAQRARKKEVDLLYEHSGEGAIDQNADEEKEA